MFLAPLLVSMALGRTRVDLNQNWEFVRTPGDGHWAPATLPHCPWIRPLATNEIWQGVTEYRRRLDLTPQMLGKRVVLNLEGAMQSSDLWLNGRQIASRRGGYLPLVVDLTGKLKAHNEILVRVDNSDNPLIPPGKPQKDLDFMYGCGLYRNAYLTLTGPVYITDPILEGRPHSGGIYVTYPVVGPARSVVRVRTHVRNSGSTAAAFRLVQVLKDRGGKVVAQTSSAESLDPGADEQFAQDLEVKKATLWSPDSPYLYSLETHILNVRFGVRELGDCCMEPLAFWLPPNLSFRPEARPCRAEAEEPDCMRRLPASKRFLCRVPRLTATPFPRNDTQVSPYNGLLVRAARPPQPGNVSEFRTPHPLTPSPLTNQRGAGELDQVITRIGIRSVGVSRERGFVLNGKPVRLVGTNRHQDYPWIGIALSDNAQYRDAVLIKRAGHNIVRLSHYPQSPAFLDACDELGIMTIPCAAGWQYMNNDPVFKNRVLQDIRELIRRDRNHPSAVFWETNLNETYAPNDIANEWNAAAKDESLDGRILTSGDGRKGSPWDVIYNQWRDEDMSRPQDAVPDKPGYIREYGDYEFGGGHSTSRVRIADGEDALMQEAWNEVWSLNRYRPQYPWTMGAGTWVMFDHNVPWDFRISACGLADLFRRPKPSYRFFASQESRAPVVKIETYRGRAVVFTNCDEVSLSLDGKRIALGRPKRTASTSYDKAKPFDGSNTGNLAHPPIVFDLKGSAFGNVRSDGKLTAEGFVRGHLVAKDTLQRPGKPAGIKVWVDDMGVPLKADGADVVFVRAAIVDANGVIVTGANGIIRFTTTGAGSVAGEPGVPIEMGVASELIRSAIKPGAIKVTARLVGGDFKGSGTVRSR